MSSSVTWSPDITLTFPVNSPYFLYTPSAADCSCTDEQPELLCFQASTVSSQYITNKQTNKQTHTTAGPFVHTITKQVFQQMPDKSSPYRETYETGDISVPGEAEMSVSEKTEALISERGTKKTRP